MVYDYTKYISMIKDKIEYYGGTANYYQNVDGEANSVTGVITYNQIITPVKILVTEYSQLVIDDVIVKVGDKQVILESTIGKPKLNDNIGINGTKYKVISVEEVIPNANDVLLYRLQTRSYFAAENAIDALTVELGTLELGALVVDLFGRDTDLTWRVIAHGHHGTDITTLITNNIWSQVRFDGGSGVTYHPNTPYVSSFMREYLYAEYTDTYFSAELLAILQEVSIETQTNTTVESLVIPSYEEVFGIEMLSSSGSYIEYFASDEYRIARWSDSLGAATLYFTRDVTDVAPAPNEIIASVNTDGTAIGQYDNFLGGVRPMIFLNSAQLVQLAGSGGYYNIQYS